MAVQQSPDENHAAPEQNHAPADGGEENLIADEGVDVAAGPQGWFRWRGQPQNPNPGPDPNAPDPRTALELERAHRRQGQEKKAADTQATIDAMQKASQATDAQIQGPLPIGDTVKQINRKEARNRSILYMDWDVDDVNLLEKVTDDLRTYAEPNMQVQTWREARSKARELSKESTPDAIALGYHKNKRPLRSHQFVVVKQAMEMLGKDITDMIKTNTVVDSAGRRVINQGLDAATKNELFAAINKYAFLDAAFRGTLKEAGRVLNISKMTQKVALDMEASADMFNRLGGEEAYEKLANLWVRNDNGDLVSKVKIARALVKGRWTDALYELFRGNMLFNIPTNMRNIFGNVGHMAMLDVEGYGTAFFQSMIQRNLDPWRAQVQAGTFRTMTDVWPQMVDATRIGFMDDSRAAEIVEMQIDGKVPRGMDRYGTKLDDFRVPAFAAEAFNVDSDTLPGRFLNTMGANYVRLPFRTMQAMDGWFKVLQFEKSIRRQSWDAAMKWGRSKGLDHRSPAVKTKALEFMNDPDMPDEWRELATAEARDMTFQTRGNRKQDEVGIRQGAMSIRSNVPGMRWVMPFTQTPANIMEKAIQYSPGLNTYAVYKNFTSGDPRLRAKAMAQLSLSWGVGATVWQFMENPVHDEVTGQDINMPLITNGAPPGVDRATLRRLGWQPYSIKLGDRYYSYNSFEPAGLVLGVWASAYTRWRAANDSLDEAAWEDSVGMVSAVMMGMGEYMKDKSMVQGLSRIFTSIKYSTELGDDALERVGSEIGSSLSSILYPQWIKQMKRGLQIDEVAGFENKMDDYYSGGPIENMLNRWKGPFGDLVPNYDDWGRKKTMTQPITWGTLEATVSPFKYGDKILSGDPRQLNRDQWLVALGTEVPKVARNVRLPGSTDTATGEWRINWKQEGKYKGQSSGPINLDDFDNGLEMYSELKRMVGEARAEHVDGMLAGKGKHAKAFRNAPTPTEFIKMETERNISSVAAGSLTGDTTKREVYHRALADGRMEGMYKWSMKYKKELERHATTGSSRIKPPMENTPFGKPGMRLPQ